MTTTTTTTNKDSVKIGLDAVTLRDLFALAALMGFCADSENYSSHLDKARASYIVAEAMLKEREKQ
jgi:hypothetical protein